MYVKAAHVGTKIALGAAFSVFGIFGVYMAAYIIGHFAYISLIVRVYPYPKNVYSPKTKLKSFAIIYDVELRTIS